MGTGQETSNQPVQEGPPPSFIELPGGLPDTKKPGTAEPSANDDCVWDYYAEIINKGHYRTEAGGPRTPVSAPILARPTPKLTAAGDEHSSHSDDELLSALPNTYFKPLQCPEEEDAATRTAQHTDAERHLRGFAKPAHGRDHIPSTRGAAKDTIGPNTVSLLRHSGVPETKAIGELPRAQNDSSDESSTESSCSPGALGARCREARAPTTDTPRGFAVVTSVPVDMTYEFPLTELAAMSNTIAKLIQDIDKLDGHRRNMMKELKVLRDITLFYHERHPELRRTCLLYTSPSPRDRQKSRMPSSA